METGVLAEIFTLISETAGKTTADDGVASAAIKLNTIIKRRRNNT